MNTEQEQWAVRFRELPLMFEHALRASEEHVIRRRPAPGEWSAIEVLGHLIDKMAHWSNRVERLLLGNDRHCQGTIKMQRYASMGTSMPIPLFCLSAYTSTVTALRPWWPLFPLLRYNVRASMANMDQ